MGGSLASCPRCEIELVGLSHQGRRPLLCPACHGLYLAAADLERQFGPALAELAAAPPDRSAEVLRCPAGCGAARAHRLAGEGRDVLVDVCPSCRGVWFDGGEVQAVFDAHRRRRRPAPSPVDRAAAELRTVAQVQQTGDEPTVGGGGLWLVQFLTGLPVEGYNPVHRTPIVTWSLIVACVVVLGLQLGRGPEFVLSYALVPTEFFAGDGVVRRLIGSMFLHAGLGHLLGNLYFLKIFGDNVEDRLGRLRFLLFYLACGVGAGLAQAYSDRGSAIPVLGASGAIGGVLAAYALFFPDARVQIAPSLVTAFRQIQIRAMFYFPWWLAWQFIAMSILQIDGVAWWAHIGGFLTGAGLATLLRNSPDARLRAIAER